jgi:phosphoribosyl 1,2-cyclic phosphate phosphodiesterase
LLQTSDEHILLDISPDFRQQFLCHAPGVIPRTVLLTHLHYDHIGGLGDLADMCFWHNTPVTIISPPEMITGLQQRYPYLGPARKVEFMPATEMALGSWYVSFHQVNHGANGYSYAICFQGPDYLWIYMPDAFQATPAQLAPLHSADLLVLGTAYWDESDKPASGRSLYDVQEALLLKQEVQARKMVFTHLSHDIDIPRHAAHLPPDSRFAEDGMNLDIPSE